MDPALIQALAALIVGSGGIVGLFAARKVRSKRLPRDERAARRVTESQTLNRYWQHELDQARVDRNEERDDLRRQVRNLQQALQEQTLSDASRIDQLEDWIWRKTGNPPPPRKPREKS